MVLVYGVLTEENWLDEVALEQLLAVSTGHQVVFHMAFDQIPRSRQFETIDWLASHEENTDFDAWKSDRFSIAEYRLVTRHSSLCGWKIEILLAVD